MTLILPYGTKSCCLTSFPPLLAYFPSFSNKNASINLLLPPHNMMLWLLQSEDILHFLSNTHYTLSSKRNEPIVLTARLLGTCWTTISRLATLKLPHVLIAILLVTQWKSVINCMAILQATNYSLSLKVHMFLQHNQLQLLLLLLKIPAIFE
jgi:hypothetical protein